MQPHLQFALINPQGKNCKRACKASAKKIKIEINKNAPPHD